MKKLMLGVLGAFLMAASAMTWAEAGDVRSVDEAEMAGVEGQGGRVGVPTPPPGSWYNP